MIQVGQVNVETELLYSWLIMLIGLAGTEVITGPLIRLGRTTKIEKSSRVSDFGIPGLKNVLWTLLRFCQYRFSRVLTFISDVRLALNRFFKRWNLS